MRAAGKLIRTGLVWLLACWLVAVIGAVAGGGLPAEAQANAGVGQSAGGRASYAGDAACLPCHQKEAAAYRKTAHHLTSQPANKAAILGSFAEGDNVLTIADPAKGSDEPHLAFVMESRPDGFYETAVAELGSKKLTQSGRVDVVIGSGVRGQTYLFWAGDRLYELPVSYWTDGRQWINSPGYKDGTANFGRRADPRCMECHAAYIKAMSPDPQMNLYDRGSLVTGIACETCHGPGAAHVAQEQFGSKDLKAARSPILNPARFDRDLQIDACALCHNGTDRKELGGAFSYVPGESMERYFAAPSMDAPAAADVHGNQVGLLKRSRCFMGSPAMTCSTCHDVHAPERTAAAYSPKCLSCHAWQSCGESKELGRTIERDCVRCHMPMQQTNAIVSVTAGRVLRTSMRTHWIRVYSPEEWTASSVK